MTPQKIPLPDDDQVLSGAIGDLLRRIKTDEDPEELARYRQLLRRNVPLPLRSLVAAYFLKMTYGSLRRKPAAPGPQPARRGEPGGRPPRAGGGRAPKAAAPAPGTTSPKPTGRFARLFISVGRNRGVHAKDLAGLFARTLQADPASIGDIRVLDNYSFLEIEAGLADRAISALSGTQLKGKQISVNYARKKEDE